MPVIHDFGAFVIRMYFRDHNPPHFHVATPDHEAKIAIEDFSVIAGHVPGRVLRRAVAWASGNKALLEARWREYNRD